MTVLRINSQIACHSGEYCCSGTLRTIPLIGYVSSEDGFTLNHRNHTTQIAPIEMACKIGLPTADFPAYKLPGSFNTATFLN